MHLQDIKKLYAETDGVGLAELVRKKEIKSSELVEAAIELIEQVDPAINSVAIKTYEFARRTAASECQGPLAGVPFLLKNVGSACEGIPLDQGMKALQGLAWSSQTEMVTRIRDAGMPILGRTNAPENGWSIGTENRLHGKTRNPFDPSRTAGGSSGGAAAAVAARLVPIAEGSDGAGSIRVPASCCGVVGLKPSRGRITYGPDIADAWFGCVYTLCNSLTVRDTAAFLDVTSGNSPGDPYTTQKPERSWLSLCTQAPKKLKIGFTRRANWGTAPDPEVMSSLDNNLRLLESLGHTLIEYDLRTDIERAWWDYNDIVSVEYSRDFKSLGSNLINRSLDDEEFCPFNRAMMQRARSLSAIEYSESISATRKAGQQFAAEIAPFDVFVSPTLTQLPRPVDYWSMEESDREAYLSRWSDAAFMFIFNISGNPAISIPGKPSKAGLPLGIQYVARHGDETTLLQLAAQVEDHHPWNAHLPVVSGLER
ncbi:amidase [Agrobacterium leguminum]|uniref:amidase n=1 Tax=Agrobacterium TaxID=357 RepID=UPI0015743A0C|nr:MULTISPECIES: amidase [Agrobacterium]MCZ7934871.1 amidase [Agrobacterium leguminum]MCZ7977006.1 amidase [Agrobacterium salinitolerans]NSX94164.1 amidase [Agrobacterium tumefaciens]NTA35508.1 amidase [Agrobacterium salinitolerans]